MKKCIRWLVVGCLLLLLLPVTIYAGAAEVATGTCGENLTWNLDSDGTLTISGTGPMDEFGEAWSHADGEEPWKEYEKSIVTVIMEEGITYIDTFAFQDYTNLQKVTIPASVTSVGYYHSGGGAGAYHGAFSGCSDLNSIGPIGSGCDLEFSWTETVPAGAFYGIPNVNKIIMPETITSIGDRAFSGFFGSPASGITSAGPIGSGCDYEFGWKTEIADGAFSNFKGLKSVLIPETINVIGASAFSGCTALTEIRIPDGVTTLENYALSDCSSLTEIILPQSLKYIGNGAVSGLQSIEAIEFPADLETLGGISYCSKLKSVVIPSKITTIGDSFFAGCSSLESIVLPDSLTTIGGWAFRGCASLKEIDIPAGLTMLKNQAFYNCTGLKMIEIPGSVKTVGDYMFSGCTALETVVLSEGITSIGKSAFLNCTALNKIIIPGTLQSVGKDVWKSVSSNILSAGPIGSSRNLEFGWTETIPMQAFTNLTALEEVFIPASIESIKYGAFSGCTSIKNVFFEGSKEMWDAIAIAGGNQPLLDEKVTIHFNYVMPEPDQVIREVRYYWGWDESEQKAFFGPDDIVGCVVNEQTDITFRKNPTALITDYVVVETQTVNGQEILRSMESVESSLGTVTAIDDGSISIGSQSWSLDLKLEEAEKYQDKYVLYHILDEKVVGIELLQVVDGTLDSWNTEYDVVLLQTDSSGSCTSFTFSPLADNQSAEVFDGTWSEGEKVRYVVDSCKNLFFLRRQQIEGEFSYLAFDNSVLDYTFQYDESWFDRSSYSPYNSSFARMAMRVAMAAGDVSVSGEENGAMALQSLMEKLGYEYSHGYSQYPTPEYDSIGFGLGSKEIITADGEACTVIMVGVRGRGYFAEWGGNFRMGDHIDDHYGFRLAADQVLDALEQYIEANQGVFQPRIKVWINGFSRAAATSNLVAADLINGRLESVTAEDVYAFCFECPQNTTSSNAKDAIYSNIVNVINPIDFVPKVAMSGLGFRRYGRDYILPALEITGNYWSLLFERDRQYREILNYGLPNLDASEAYDNLRTESLGQMAIYNDFADDLASEVKNRTFYTRVYQNSMMNVFATFMGGANTATMEDLNEALSAILNIDITDFVITALNGSFTNAHNMELCLAWLDSLDHLNTTGSYRKVVVNCPVDVSVYKDGVLVGKISEDVPAEIENGIATYVDQDGQKVLILPADMEYDIELDATGSGSMSFAVSEYDLSDGTVERVISYSNLPIENGIEFTAKVEEQPVAEYLLFRSDGTKVEPTVNQIGNEVESFVVSTVCDGEGIVSGGGCYTYGEFARITAVAAVGSDFLGWYVDNICISRDTDYRFQVTESAELCGKFVSKESLMISLPDQVVMNVGESVDLPVGVYPFELADNILWSVELGGEAVVSVNSSGTVTGLDPGVAYVLATLSNGEKTAEARCQIDVVNPTSKWDVAFANMSLSNSLAMNFAFAQGNETDWTGCYAKITKTYADGRADAVVTLPAAQWGKATIGGVPHYTISFKGIAAKEMGDEIHVCIYNADGEAVSNVWTDSALKYALRAYGAANATEKEKRMLIDMLNYGAAAQQLFGYDAEHLVTAGLSDEQKAMATKTVEAKSSIEKGANYLGTNLSLESEIRINMAFKGVTEGMYAKVSLTNHAGRGNEEVAQMDIEGSTGVVRVNQIAVADGRTMVTVTVYKADGSVHGSVVDSLEGYISRVIDKEQHRAELYRKILMFADSTYNFKH